jgi:uncharacterized membrane protein SirB2
MEYATLKSIHTGAAGLSIALFILRGAWRAWSPRLLLLAFVRIAPHVIDTVLLLSAVWLAAKLPAAMPHGWLAAKLVALVAYIVLGTIALKRGRTAGVRIAAFAAALATFGYIVSVAMTKNPQGFLLWL